MVPWRLWVKSEGPENSNASKQMVGVCLECPTADLGYLQGKVDWQGQSPRFPWVSC